MFDRRFFVLAPSYHGATLLARLLHAHPQVVALGDTYPSNRFDQTCGCGSKVSECAFWQTVARRVAAERYRNQPTLLPYDPVIAKGRIGSLLGICAPIWGLRRLIDKAELEQFCTDYRKFLAAIHELAGFGRAMVYVDGIKSISRVRSLVLAGEQVDGVIHLVRDPNDYVRSYMKQKKSFTLPVLARAAALWRLYHNRAASLNGWVPYFRISYEELTDRTEETTAGLFQFLGVPPIGMDEMTADFREPWHFMGNASLLKFDGRIRRSRHNPGRLDRYLVRAIAGADPSL